MIRLKKRSFPNYMASTKFYNAIVCSNFLPKHQTKYSLGFSHI